MTSSSFSVSSQTVVMTTEMHSAGEPLRIVDLIGGRGCQLNVVGTTLLDKRRHVREHLDALRRFLMWEPRGHHDMYGALLVEPDHPGNPATPGVHRPHLYQVRSPGFSRRDGRGITWNIAANRKVWQILYLTASLWFIFTPCQGTVTVYGDIWKCLFSQSNIQRIIGFDVCYGLSK